MVTIRVVDSIMGSGKTSWATQFMNQNPGKAFIFVTPYLEEVERIKRECPGLQFYSGEEGQKFKDFKKFLAAGKNIVATHKCFQMADDEVRALLEGNDYTLIMDEVFDVVIDIPLAAKDIEAVLSLYADVDETGLLVWKEQNYPEEGGKFSDIMKMARTKGLMVFNNSFLLWLFPVEIFKCFREVYVLTYLFEGQVQRHYFDLNNLPYDSYQVQQLKNSDGCIVYDLVPRGTVIERKCTDSVETCDNEKMNAVGRGRTTLSSTWYDNNKSKWPILKNNLVNFFQNIHHAKSDDVMWTTFEKAKEELKGKGYTNGFVSCNARATNKFENRSKVAYCVNWFMRPVISNYFKAHNIEVDEDNYALSAMLQFIWRSAIRKNPPIKIDVYVPSERMRTLLRDWLKK